MQPLRIIFFIDCLTSGGRERRLVELLKGLKTHDQVEFELVIMSRDVHYIEVLNLGIKIHYLVRSSRKDLSIFGKFYKICLNFKPDIVHSWDTMTAIYSIFACKLLGIKFINGMISNSPRKQNVFNKYWLRGKLTFPFSDVIIGNSKSGLEAYHAPKSRSICVYNGFNFERKRKMIEPDAMKEEMRIHTPYMVGMVAYFSPAKDYRTFFEAAQKILSERKDVTFVAIGKKTDSTESKSLIHPDNTDYFRLMGEQSDIESFINAMDICVLATFTEGVSNAILEYMALGKPVIATEGGGTSEIVRDGESGFLVGASNPLELSEKMEELLDAPDLRKKMGSRGREIVSHEFSIEKMVSEYLHIYNNLTFKVLQPV